MAGIDGLKGDNALDAAVEGIVVLMNRVAAKHTEHGDGNLPLGRLGGHVGIDAAGVVGLIPVAAPEGVAVGAVLVLTVARGGDVVLVAEVRKGVGIDEPRADGRGIAAEDGMELRHIDVHKAFTLIGGVAGGEAYVGMPVPGVAAAPRHAGIADVGLGDFPPCAHLVTAVHGLRQQLLVGRVDEGVVLQQEGAAESLFVQLSELIGGSLEEVVVGEAFVAWLGLTDEIHEVDDAGLLLRNRRLAGREGQDSQQKAYCRKAEKRMAGHVYHGRRKIICYGKEWTMSA